METIIRTKKSNILHFSKKKRINTDLLKFKLYGEYLTQVKDTKFLGITFGSKLNFKKHFSHIEESLQETESNKNLGSSRMVS